MPVTSVSDRMRTRQSRLSRLGGMMLSSLALVLLSGCFGPEALQRRLDEMQPAAIAAAKERARIDLGCEEPITTEVLSRTPGGSNGYSLDRAEYKIAATGCRKRIPLAVACTGQSLCSALAEDAVAESVPQK